MPETLSAQHQAFVDEYIIDFNATKAAIRAGYTEKTARQQGSRLLSHADIQEAIRLAIEGRSKRTKVDADWLLTHCSQMLTADIGDILDELGHFKPIHDWPKIWRQMLNGTDIKEIFAYTGGEEGAKDKVGEIIKAKFVSREKIMELTGKHINVAAFIGQDNQARHKEEPEPLDEKFL